MQYFSISELERSDMAVARGIKNTAPEEIRENMRLLTERVLDPAREAFGHPIYVNSGYRSAKVNAMVGGSAKSQHLSGCAADLNTGSVDGNRRLAKLIVELDLPFDQLIDEKSYSWVHVSHNPNGPQRHDILRISRRKTIHITYDQL